MKEIRYYKTEDEKIPFIIWYETLDNSLKIIVDKRLSKVERGLFGTNKRLSENLYELKFDNGLRIYYTEFQNTIIILFSGGNKKRQNTDIENAKNYLNEFLERNKNE